VKSPFVITALVSCAVSALCQQQPPNPNNGHVPIYQVTVVERTVKAINYQYRSDPTMVDFRGTVLLPKAKGDAWVQSKQGRTEIEARLENLPGPQRFGLEYMTYVLWALTPDGRPHNIGEVIPGTSDKAKLHVTTDMQAFAMIVTAEPYSAVRQPSNVVVLENVVRPDTVGKIEEVDAKVELLPRGLYSYHVPDQLESASVNAPKVSMREYEALSELYQAQNAVGVARAAAADRYAPNTFAKAQQLLDQAQQLQNHKRDSSSVVETAREAAQTAEDARLIAVKHQQEESLARANFEAAKARNVAAQATSEAQQARADAQSAQAQADAERAARQRAEADAADARDRAAQAESQIKTVVIVPPPQQPQPDEAAVRKNLRMQILEQLNGTVPSRDTGRGLVATVPDSGFAGFSLRPASSDQVARMAAIVLSHPGLRIEVEGNTDGPDTSGLSQRRADAVREILVGRGVPPSAVVARGLGNSHPIGSSRTAADREQNQRVEIVISGDPIGNIPFWDQTYTLTYHR
jgi:outer membrane protein OmpA-like peptidoglycan-associated protein